MKAPKIFSKVMPFESAYEVNIETRLTKAARRIPVTDE